MINSAQNWEQWVACMRIQDIFMHKNNPAQSIGLEDIKSFQDFCATESLGNTLLELIDCFDDSE